jgi:hypothetical protein
MHGPIKFKSPNNISKWQLGFNSAFKGLKRGTRLTKCSSKLWFQDWKEQTFANEDYKVERRFVDISPTQPCPYTPFLRPFVLFVYSSTNHIRDLIKFGKNIWLCVVYIICLIYEVFDQKRLCVITGIKDGKRTRYLVSGKCWNFKFKFTFSVSYKIFILI